MLSIGWQAKQPRLSVGEGAGASVGGGAAPTSYSRAHLYTQHQLWKQIGVFSAEQQNYLYETGGQREEVSAYAPNSSSKYVAFLESLDGVLKREWWGGLPADLVTQTCTEGEAPIHKVRGMEDEWIMFKASIVEEAAQSCGQKIVGACCGSNQRPFQTWWPPRLLQQQTGTSRSEGL